MTRSVGKDFLLQASGVPGAGANFTTVADLQTNAFTINNSEVDISTKDSGQFRDLFPGGAVTSVEMSAEGVVTDEASHDFLRDTALYGNPIARFRMLDGTSGDAIEGDFQISSWENTGPKEGAVTFSASFASTGVVVIASGVS